MQLDCGEVDDDYWRGLRDTVRTIRELVDDIYEQFVQAVAETNARLAAHMLLDRSPTMSGLVDAGSLKVVSAMHDIGTGRVSLLA